MKKPQGQGEPKKSSKKPKTYKGGGLRTPQERRELCELICQSYESADVTIASCCESHGIAMRTFFNYVEDDAQIAARYKKAKAANAKLGRDGIKEKALSGLQKLLTGYFVDDSETEVTEIKNKHGVVVQTITRTKTRKKYISPNATAIIFALKNTDPENWNEDRGMDGDAVEEVFKIGDQVIKF